VQSAGREAFTGSVGAKARKQVAGKRRQVIQAFAQRGNLEWKDGETVVEIKTEISVDHPLFKIAVRGGDDANVDPSNLVITDALEFAALEEAKELGLNGEWEFANLVKEECASVGGFDAAGAGLDGSGEGAAGVTEEFSFEKRLRNRGAVEHGERLGRSAAEAVDRGGHDLLARARLAFDEYGRVTRGDQADEIRQLAHRGALANEAGDGKGARLGRIKGDRTGWRLFGSWCRVYDNIDRKRLLGQAPRVRSCVGELGGCDVPCGSVGLWLLGLAKCVQQLMAMNAAGAGERPAID